MILKRKNYSVSRVEAEQREFASIRKLKKGLDVVGKEMATLAKNNPDMTKNSAKQALEKSSKTYKSVAKSINKLDTATNLPKALKNNASQIENRVNKVEEIFKSFKPNPKPVYKFPKNSIKH